MIAVKSDNQPQAWHEFVASLAKNMRELTPEEKGLLSEFYNMKFLKVHNDNLRKTTTEQ